MEDLRAGLDVTPMLHLLRPLGEGGMGKVWVARHKKLETDVVVKFLSVPETNREEAEIRFAREAASAAAVKSPHVVQVFDHGTTAGGLPYIVMELLEGRDLATHLAVNGPMAPRDVGAVVTQIAKALSKAHQVGVIHRDIKPENVFLCDGDAGEMFVKVLDFGIAKRPQEEVTAKTTTGQVVGTPFYMSPEQILGEQPIDSRSDIWSLGVVAFEALTGKRPFDGATVGSITLAIHRSAPRPCAVRPDLPPALDEWFARACARDPADRFPTARDAAVAITTAVEGAPATPPLFRPTAISVSEADLGLAAAAAAATAATAGTHERSVTHLSSSFAAEPRPKKPPRAVLLGAIIAVVSLVVLVVVAMGRTRPEADARTNATLTPASGTLAAASGTAAASAVASSLASSPSPSSVSSASPPAESPSVTASALVTAPTPSAKPAPAMRPGPRPAPKPAPRPTRKPSDDDIK